MALGTTNISVDLIKQTIGESSNDVGTLCRSGNIAKWAKYRPFAWGVGFVDLTSGDNYQGPTITHPSANQSAGLTGKFTGFKPYLIRLGSSNDCNYIVNAYNTGGMNGWEFMAPTGGAAAPYRLGDFRKYEHSSTCPFLGTTFDGARFLYNDVISVYANLDLTYPTNGLNHRSIPAINSLYYGFLIKGAAQSDQWMLYTDTDTWDYDSVASATLTRALYAIRQYTLYPVLCDKPGLSGLIDYSQTPLVCTLPYFTSKSFSVVQTLYEFAVEAWLLSVGDTTADGYIIATEAATQGETVTLTDVYVFADNSPDWPADESEYYPYNPSGDNDHKCVYYAGTITRTQKPQSQKSDADRVIRLDRLNILRNRDGYLHFKFTHNGTTYTMTNWIVN